MSAAIAIMAMTILILCIEWVHKNAGRIFGKRWLVLILLSAGLLLTSFCAFLIL